MDNLQFINDVIPISFNITRNHIFIILSILGLSIFTYLSKRYLYNTAITSNQYYTKTKNTNIHISQILNNNANSANASTPITYIFWNGDINSTYLIIDLLIQGFIIQPMYIEKYTILKTLEYENLGNIVKQYSGQIQQTQTKTQTQTQIKIQTQTKTQLQEYLKKVANIKHIQNNESTQIDMLTNLIQNQYPEFKHNLLPTLFITSIAKDMIHTTEYINTINKLKPQHNNGIEFIEQITRFIKHNKINKTDKKDKKDKTDKKDKKDNHDKTIYARDRILLGYNSEHKYIKLIQTLITQYNTENNLQLNIEIPLQTKNTTDIHYLTTNIISHNIMTYFKKI